MGVFGTTRVLPLWEKRQPIRSFRYRNRCGSATIFRKTATDHDDAGKPSTKRFGGGLRQLLFIAEGSQSKLL